MVEMGRAGVALVRVLRRALLEADDSGGVRVGRGLVLGQRRGH